MKVLLFIAWFIPLPIAFKIENAIRKRNGRKPVTFEHSYAFFMMMPLFLGATGLPLICAALIIAYTVIGILGAKHGGIGERFEAKNYTDYFHATVNSNSTMGKDTDAVVCIERENELYFVRDIYILENNKYTRYHFRSLLCETQIFPLSKTSIREGVGGIGEAWDVIVTDIKPIPDFAER